MKIFHFRNGGNRIYLSDHIFILAHDETEARTALGEYLIKKRGEDFSSDYRVESVKDDHEPQLVVAFSGHFDE